MSLINNNDVIRSKRYSLATVTQVILLDVIKLGKKVLLKYSVRCKIRGIPNIQTCRYFGNPQFITLPKLTELIYVWLTDLGYFWTRRFDKDNKGNLGFDHILGNTYITGSNHDIIILNGQDRRSQIKILSNNDRGDKFSAVLVIGLSGRVTLMSSDIMVLGSKVVKISSSDLTSIKGKKDLLLSGKSSIVSGADGVIISNDLTDKDTLPMVLGNKLTDWLQRLMDDISSFLGDIITLTQTRVGRAGPGGPRAARKFATVMNLKKRTFLQSSKAKLKRKLSKKNKVS